MNDKAQQQREENAGFNEGGKTSTNGPTDATDRDQTSALGGDVATRSSTAETPEDEKVANRGENA